MNIMSNAPHVTDPHSIEAEQQVIGAILVGRSTSIVESAGGYDLFFEYVHAEIYKACRELEKADKKISPIIVSSMLPENVREQLAELGGNNYIARMAGAAISPEHLGNYADLLAEKHAKRIVLNLARTAQYEIHAEERKASDIAAQLEVGLQALEASETSVKPVSITAAVTDVLSDVKSFLEGRELPIVRHGIYALENYVKGFAPGELWLLGGRPSMGKTACALSIGLNAARMGHSVVIASLEMTPKSLAMRALSEGTAHEGNAIAYASILSGQISEFQLDGIKSAAKKLADLPIVFLPREYQEVDLLQVGAKQVLRNMNTRKPPLIIVDYAQLMRSKARTRYEQITDISLALKGMAMNLNVPVVALSQLSRALESRDDKRPTISDLRESGQLEQDADGVMFCYRDEYYIEREKPDGSDVEEYADWENALRQSRNRLEILVAKQRQGPIGTANVRFNPALNYIWED